MTAEKKHLRVIEELGQILINKDRQIKLNEYEIKALKKKIESIEKYIELYEKKKHNIFFNYDVSKRH